MKKITEVIVEGNIYSAYLKRSKRSKTALKVTDNLEIIISSPKNLSENEFKKILKNTSLWIESEVIKKKKFYEERKVKEFQDGRVIWLNGKCYDLVPNNKQIANHLIKGNIIYISKNFSYKKVYDEVLKKIEIIFTKYKRLLDFVPNDTILNFKYYKSRWGVCYFKKKEVILNELMAILPDHLIEYIVVHELVHFKYQSHGRYFHDFLEKLIPGHMLRQKELNFFTNILYKKE